MKKALLIGGGLALVVIVALPLVMGKGARLPSGAGGGENDFLTPDYAKRLGLREVSQETFRACPTGLTYKEVTQRFGVPGVQLQQKDDLPPIPFETMLSIWRKDIAHPEKDVYAWVSPRGEVMTLAFRNGKIIHIYYGQDAGPNE